MLVGLDTSVNQYVMTHPDYLFARAIEQAVIDPDNPFVTMGHLRCATHELPLAAEEVARFGPHTELVLRVLQDNHKVRQIGGRWYHAASETPQHEVGLRDTADRSVTIQDADTGEVLGQVNKFDAPPILHPEAIYIHQGQTYRVLELDIETKFLATVKRVEVDYFTQPLGGTDVDHIDACLRERPFGTGRACWGEVTAYFRNSMYEKVRFYELDAISRHGLDLPVFQLQTMAVWLIPPEELTEQVRRAGLDAHAGLRGIGYATRMLLPLFITCDTLSFSHTVGSANSPWNTIFLYERTPLGLGFTRAAYERLGVIMPAVLENLRTCPCPDGCPCCTGKPLRQYATWDVQRGETSVPSKAAARMILEGLLAGGAGPDCPDSQALCDGQQAAALQLEQALRRRLERMREPQVLHPIEPQVETKYPQAEDPATLDTPDLDRRLERRTDFHRGLRKRLAKKIEQRGGEPPKAAEPKARKRTLEDRLAERQRACGAGILPALPEAGGTPAPQAETPSPADAGTIHLGSSLAARARKLKKQRNAPAGGGQE